MKEFGDELIDKKWIYLERNTLNKQYGTPQKVREPQNGMISFYGINFIG